MKTKSFRGRSRIASTALPTGYLLLISLFVLTALALSSLTLSNRSVLAKEGETAMPTLSGDAAVDYLTNDGTYSSLRAAMATIDDGDDPTISPQAATKLFETGGSLEDFFGYSVAISGDTAIVGAINDDLPGASNCGSAHIFVRNGTSWTLQQKLTAPDATGSNRFGWSVGISGDTAVIGKSQDAPFGSAFVYVRTGTTWAVQQRLSPPSGGPTAAFGYSVAIEGETIIVGDYADNSGATRQGSVYVYQRTGTNWVQEQKLTASDGSQDDFFGWHLSLSGNNLIVGARFDQVGSNRGSAYVFIRNGITWTQQQKLTPSGITGGEDFGWRVAIHGDAAVVGAPNDDVNGNMNQGSAYLYSRTGTVWTQQERLIAPDGELREFFGGALAITDDTLLVGASQDDFGTAANRGSVYFYDRCAPSGTTPPKIIASDGVAADQFGHALALSGDSLIVGAPGVAFGANTTQGAVYIFPHAELPQPQCKIEIKVNITTDLADANLEDDVCDVDTGQSGQQCSLRAAIETANANAGPDDIKFDIPGGGTHTITVFTQLPSLSETATIDATTQPGYSGTPLIELSGNSSIGGIGFVAGSSNSILRGVAINRFGVGIGLQASGVSIEKCYFGLSPDGSAAGTTSDQVVAISISSAAASNNTIGGVGNLGNVISNNGIGIGIFDGATGNKVLGNRIGTNISGTSAIPNTFGALIQASSGNKIGDTVTGSGNLISGSTSTGVYIREASFNNLIAGNLIGTNAAGTEAIANESGVFIDASNNNRVGSDTGANGNVISGSTFTAVTLKAGAANNVIVGNKIGTNLDGTAAIPNQFGVGVDAANDNTIGDLVASAKGNLISGNSQMGVVLQGNSATNRVTYNSIGTKANGTEVLPNGEVGVLLTGGATDNTLEKNVIGGHSLPDTGSGIGISASAGPANLVFDNFIGVARNGTTPLPNWFGIGIAADGQTVGSQSRPNLIGKNKKAGIVVSPAPGNPVVENNTIEGNWVGTNSTANVGNDEFGIWLNGAVSDNTISHNYVSGNFFVGIAVTDGSSSNDILDNFVGINVGGTQAISNGIGIWVRQATDNTISRNLVSGNDIGMLIGTNIGFGTTAGSVKYFQSNSEQSNQGGTFTSGNHVFLNLVGVGLSGAIPNRIGIAVGENARNNFIGGAKGANLISGNTNPAGWGILIGTLSQTAAEETFPQFNLIQSNRIGTTPDLQGTMPNTVGIVLVRAARNTIGGDTDALANFIMANTQEGILMSDGTGENILLKNYVGKLPPGFASRSKAGSATSPNGAFGNGGHGILIENGAHGNTLGGATSATGLVISDNGGNGIRLDSTAGGGNSMGANSITNNTLPGIDLGGDGFTVNDPTDADVGPNNLQNYPTMTFFISGGNLIVNYQVDSALVNSNYGTSGLTVQFYKADGSGAGVSSLGSDQYTASDYSNGSPGFKKKNLGNAAALGFMAGDTMTATATDADGNSSEFAPVVSSAPSAISGTITYGNAIGSPSPRFVSNVLLSGAGSTNVSTTTAAPGAIAGQYTLMGFGAGSYTVTPSKTGGSNSITSFDAARISQHVAGPPNPQLTGNQLVVADVSGNSVVSSFDAAMIAKFAAGPPYVAPGIGSTSIWRFTPTTKNYASVANSISGEDYSALLMGEVSGNWNNTGARPFDRRHKAEESSGPERGISVELPTLVSVDKEIVVPVNVQGIANKGVIAYEFDLRYDPTVIQPTVEPADLKDTASRGLLVVTNAAEPGLLRVVVYGAYPIEGDGVLLNLRFTAAGSAGSVSPISFERIMFNEGEARVLVTDGKIELF